MGGSPNNGGFQAGTANILQPTTAADVTGATATAQGALGQQQQLAQALQSQGQQGMNSQTALTQALTAQAAGHGPNVAQNQLAQATGQNVQQTAAQMAGARGASGNVGLMARQIGGQGAATQQQAAGQAATLGAQQQMAAQGQLQSLAGTQVGQQAQAVSGLNSAAQNEQSNVMSSLNAQNNANVSSQSSANSANAAMAQTNANNSAGAIGGLLNGAGSVAAMALLAKGGVVSRDKMLPAHLHAIATAYHPHKYASGGYVPVQNVGAADGSFSGNALANTSQLKGGSLNLPSGGYGNGGITQFEGATAGSSMSADPMDSGNQQINNYMNGPQDALQSNQMELAAKGGPVKAQNPSQKAVKNGDSYSNDKIPALLSEGEVVIDKDTLNDSGPMGKLARKLAAHMEEKNNGDGKEDFKKALKGAIASRKKAS